MRDRDELTWYLTHGLSTFERSTFGAILDVLESRAYTSQVCHHCWGSGILSEKKCFRVDGQKVYMPDGAWCPVCHGTGAISVRITTDDLDAIQTVHATGHSSESNSRSAPPDEALARYALVSRRLYRMSPHTRDALVAAYGDAGQIHAKDGIRGRAWAVAPLTVPGRKLLRHARDRRDANPDQALGNEDPVALLTAVAQLDASSPLPERTRLLAEAIEASWELLREAEREWERAA